MVHITRKPSGDAMVADVAEWLTGLGLSRYADAFVENEVTPDILSRLTTEDLRDLGITLVGHRRKLLDAIAELKAGAPDQPARADPLSTSSTPEQTAGERRHLTVMFCDLCGSTQLATRLDPEEMREVLVTYQNVVSGEIARLGGYISKFMGDGILAFFGYPIAHEDNAERAIRAALAVRQAVTQLTAPTKKHLSVRIGIASGFVVVGHIVGTGAAAERSVVGETPNLAARLQSAAAPNQVLLAASTRQLASDLFQFEETGPLDLKGFEGSVRAFRVVGESNVESRFEARSAGELRPMVGRDKELRLLLDRWRIAKSGEGHVAVVRGEAGIGKSRLTRAMTDVLSGEPHHRAQCTSVSRST